MPTGNVKWFDTKKGYGFIVGEAGQDVFVHYTSILGDGFRSLKDGEVVDYELVQSDKGFQARNVKRLAAPARSRPRPGAGRAGGPGKVRWPDRSDRRCRRAWLHLIGPEPLPVTSVLYAMGHAGGAGLRLCRRGGKGRVINRQVFRFPTARALC